MLVYLFGRMKDLTQNEAGDWRKEAQGFCRKYRIPVYNPMHHVPILKKNEKIGNYYTSREQVGTEDRYFLRKADILLGRLNDTTLVGSSWEMGAAEILNKTIIVFDVCDEIREHPLIRTSWDIEFKTLKESLNYIKKLSLIGE